MNVFRRSLPGDSREARQALYRGDLFLIDANDASRRLVERVREAIDHEAGCEGDPREAQFRLGAGEFFERIGRLRRLFYTSPAYHALLPPLIDSLGFVSGEHAVDPVRLRVISHEGHLNADARPMYYGHRDTWYSNPQAMITWWIPLHDVEPRETFDFFPDAFDTVMENDSEIFDFDRWVHDGQQRRIGWQDPNTGRTAGYPQLRQSPPGRAVPVSCGAADILLFSAQHLHQTRENTTGRSRMSLDFRTVHLEDHRRGIGPANRDNRSTGSSIVQFVPTDGIKATAAPPAIAPGGAGD